MSFVRHSIFGPSDRGLGTKMGPEEEMYRVER